jgi:hypothetical protein
MTRGNINYQWQEVGQSPKTLYFYYNGDQYPDGLRDLFNVLDFTNGDWSRKSFEKWLADNYTEQGRQVTSFSNGVSMDAQVNLTEPAKAEEISHPCIYYDNGGFPTDYSYVFSRFDKTVMVYNWEKLIFSGDPKKFERWIKKQ